MDKHFRFERRALEEITPQALAHHTNNQHRRRVRFSGGRKMYKVYDERGDYFGLYTLGTNGKLQVVTFGYARDI